MKIIKEGAAESCAQVSAEELALINRYTKKELGAQDVFTFAVVLCDNDVDRDFERFSEKTLRELKELFIGKTGISDHDWTSGGQVARIYRTELQVSPEKKNSLGGSYVCLKAWAYILRTQANAQLIADIEGGIKKETSVGCAVKRRVCSICGEEMDGGKCSHVKGRSYGGRLCYAVLEDAVDAYEWSFVAVPAQKAAGVTKAFDVSKGLKGFVESREGQPFAPELETLEAEAELGREYKSALRAEVLRLSLICDRAMHRALAASVETMDADALKSWKATLEKQAAEKLPLSVQLPGANEITRFDGGEYLI